MVHEPVGQIVEQLRVRRRRAHVAEVVGRVDDATAEVVVPDAVHDRPAGEQVVRAREPSRQGGAARAFVVGIR